MQKTNKLLHNTIYSDFDIAHLSETWLTDSILFSGLFDNSYGVYRTDRNISVPGFTRREQILDGVKNTLQSESE